MSKLIISEKLNELKNELILIFDLTYKTHENLLFFASSEKKNQKMFDENFENYKKLTELHQSLFKKIVYFFASFNIYEIALRTLLSYSYINLEIKRIADYANNLTKYYMKTPNKLFIPVAMIKNWKTLLKNLSAVKKSIQNPKINEISSLLLKVDKHNLNDIFNSPKINSFLKNISVRERYYFFMQFRFLDRTIGRLVNILEYLLLLKSFFDYQIYQKNKLNEI